MKTLITTTLALGVILTLSSQVVEARHFYGYSSYAPVYNYGPGYAYVPGYGYNGYYGGYGYNRGIVGDVIGGIFGGW